MIGANIVAQMMNGQMKRDDLLDNRSKALQDMAANPMGKEQIKKIASEFEEMFISQMLEHMFSGESAGIEQFGGAEGGDIYKSMMVEQYGKAISRAGGIGIAQHIERSLMQRALINTQEV